MDENNQNANAADHRDDTPPVQEEQNGDQQAQAVQNSEVRDLIALVRDQMHIVRQQADENLQLRTELTELTYASKNLSSALDQSTKKRPQTKKPDRPTIDVDTSESEWAIFIDLWERYKGMCELRELKDVRNELRLTCSVAVNRRLFELNGAKSLDEMSEEHLLNAIKEVAVTAVHHQVHRQRFCQIAQGEGEAISQYIAKVKAQADLCSFQVQCQGCEQAVSYRDDMVASQTINGLSNARFQARILEEAPTLESMKELYNRLISLEATEKSSSSIQSSKVATTSAAAAGKSEYQQAKTKKRPPTRNAGRQNTSGRNNATCPGCGSSSHGEGKSLQRSHCPARNMKCFKCGRHGHKASVCSQPKAASATSGEVEEEESYQNSVSFACTGKAQDFRGGTQNNPKK